MSGTAGHAHEGETRWTETPPTRLPRDHPTRGLTVLGHGDAGDAALDLRCEVFTTT